MRVFSAYSAYDSSAPKSYSRRLKSHLLVRVIFLLFAENWQKRLFLAVAAVGGPLHMLISDDPLAVEGEERPLPREVGS